MVRNIVRRVVVIAGLAACLPACASQEVREKAAEIGQHTLEDMRKAEVLARRSSDTLALQCYAYLIPKLEARLAAPSPDGALGPIATYQQGRNIRLLLESRESIEFRLACGPMIGDTRDLLRRLATGVLR